MNVSPAQLSIMLNDEDLVLVNVSIPSVGNSPATDLSIPYYPIHTLEYLNQLPTEKNAKIGLYCRSGRMNEVAATELVWLGYTNIWNLEGGMVEGENAG